MKTEDITRTLTELGIEHFLDRCNPDYTVHIKKSGTMIDSFDPEGPWALIRYDGRLPRFSPNFTTTSELHHLLVVNGES